MIKINKIYCMDCLEGLKQMEDNSVDLIVTDPPYYNIVTSGWDNQWKTFEEYLDWLEQIIKECKRILTDKGSIYIFADDERVAYIQVRLDKFLTYLNSLVWYKPNNIPFKYAHKYRKFCPMSERILFYSTQKSKTGLEEIEDNYIKPQNPMSLYLKSEIEKSKVSIIEISKLFPSKTGNLTGCVSNWLNGYSFPLKEQYLKIKELLNKNNLDEYLRKEYEYLRKEYEDLRKEYEKERRVFNFQSGIHEIITEPIIQKHENTEHPTTKPVRLIKKFIEISSNKGDIILDPFMGSGTTAVACKELDRKFIGFEMKQKYVDIANKRLEETERNIKKQKLQMNLERFIY